MPAPVTARLAPLTLPTYAVGAPEKNPVFFEKRVYQGSNGRVYPVPFIDRVCDEPRPVTYRAAHLENEYVRLTLLPEIGGRLLTAQDKSNCDYDFFYRQDVIKPALVGLAGPWISGGVEFNWPQHHRPGTFLPADVWIEEEPDGARTVWLTEHDPISHLRGLHGFRLRPGSSLIELRVRLFNRTPVTQTFLWWANAAARVHGEYESFFPPDVHYVADHAVRAQSSFPFAHNPYYGVRYQDRPGANDLRLYKNIPVPTSYMVGETAGNFLGGYDHAAQGGFVHVANRHIVPGKKQWTWGDHPFGHAWDRELTDTGGPYIELMAGAYTDNQPDFSYLLPYEVRTFSHFWWPIQQTGPVQAANEHAALRLVVGDDKRLDLGALVSAPLPGARVTVRAGDRVLVDERRDLHPGQPWLNRDLRVVADSPDTLELVLRAADDRELLRYRPVVTDTSIRNRPVATEPPAPAATGSTDELYFIGEHLDQYRHPTRDPEAYWHEALRRDPGDARCHLGLGKRLFHRVDYAAAAEHFGRAIQRLTTRHPNPETGEAHYYLGLVRRAQGHAADAYALLYKATWNYAWRAAAYYALATIDVARGDLPTALAHLESSLDTNRRNNHAHVLQAAVLRRLGRNDAARNVLRALLATDPLDHWARYELSLLEDSGAAEFLALCRNDAQTVLDLAFDYADAGLFTEAIGLLALHHAHPVTPAPVPNPLGRSPSTRYACAWLHAQAGRAAAEVAAALADARAQSPDHFFPARRHEHAVLTWAVAQPGADPHAHFALGNYHYDLRRHADAIAHWESAVAAGAIFATVHRNLGLAYWNVHRDGPRARAAYARARQLDPHDGRLGFEFDQLRKKLNEPLAARLATLEAGRAQVTERDDASVELAALYNLLDRPADALALLNGRRFHPWEGGEGAVLRQYTAARLRLGQHALTAGDATAALAQFTAAMDTPANLGEAYHLLAATTDVDYWTGCALRALGRTDDAQSHFAASAETSGDFAEMAVTAHSPLTYYRGLALRALGRDAGAEKLFADLRAFATARLGEPATIDYFATSLPNLMVFEEDLQARRDAENHLLLALAAQGLGDTALARTHLARVFTFTNSDSHATDLARALGFKP
jgi:tetratricopeptide (TPR) repeat protein